MNQNHQNKIYKIEDNTKEKLTFFLKKIKNDKSVKLLENENKVIIESINKGDFLIELKFDTKKIILSTFLREGTNKLNKTVLLGVFFLFAPIILLTIFRDENLFFIEKFIVVLILVLVFFLISFISRIYTYVLGFDLYKKKYNKILNEINKIVNNTSRSR